LQKNNEFKREDIVDENNENDFAEHSVEYSDESSKSGSSL